MISTLSKKHSFDLIFHSQQVYRLILEAMSNPGRVVSIKKYADRLFGINPELLAVAVALLDSEVSFNTCGGDSFPNDIASLTYAKQESINNADFIFARVWSDMCDAIKNAKSGTHSDPHKNATIVIFNEGDAACSLTLTGPGVNERITVEVTQTIRDAIEMRDARNYEYPQGIDLIFVSAEGELFAIPRLVKVA